MDFETFVFVLLEDRLIGNVVGSLFAMKQIALVYLNILPFSKILLLQAFRI
jgi:hypothetical protein